MIHANLKNKPSGPEQPRAPGVIIIEDAVFGLWNAAGKLYVVPTAVQAKKGYWVAVGQDINLEVTGVPPAASSVHLLAGWNLVGPVDTGACPSGPPVLAVYGWGWPPNYQYVLSAQCEEGKGDWIAVIQEGDGW